MSSGIDLRGPKLPPGVDWGELRVRDGGRLKSVAWMDPWLPERLTDPGGWLPASAWADRRTSAYVASHYAICVPPNPMRMLPAGVQDLLLVHGTRIAEMELNECYRVATDAARQIAASFVAAGIGMNESLGGLVTRQWGVSFAPMTPSGESICLECGRRQP
jgi:hypothetical protein